MSGGRRAALATQAAVALEPAPFPHTTTEEREETGFADWRVRLRHNLARRSDGRWDPLTHVDRAGS